MNHYVGEEGAMKMQYAVSLWNYYFYGERQGHKSPEAFAQGMSLAAIIADVKAAGYGIEIWSKWQGRDLFAPPMRDELAPLLKGVNCVSVHTGGARDFAAHEKQIDAAASWGAGVLVLHTPDLADALTGKLDAVLAGEVEARARENGIVIALENGSGSGSLDFLAEALSKVDGLKVCLDTGHVYKTPQPLRQYLDRLGSAIVHLHLEDNLAEPEASLPGSRKPVHYRPGTGSIPEADWELLFHRLREHRFCGTAVIEIQPRNPLQLAELSIHYLERFQQNAKGLRP